jgi:hypothetical protein
MFGRYKFLARNALVFIFLFYGDLMAFAQESLPPAPTLQNPNTGANLARFFSSKTPYEFWLACMIGLLGLAIVISTMVTLARIENIRPEEITRPVIILSVITGTLMLVTVGYSNDQIAPAFGLFGTIIGYMLGRLAQPHSAIDTTEDAERLDAKK